MTHKARKRFGQHFLTDISVLNRITQAVRLNQTSLVEIGPGQGALTDYLINQFGKLSVIELDRDLVALLQRRYGDNIHILSEDILNVDLKQLIQMFSLESKLTLIGNLPYNISTPLIFHLIDQLESIDDMVFMVQKEVALRVCAKPNNKQYGRLSVMTSTYLESEILFDVPPSAFNPPPKVDSSVMRLTPKKNIKPISNPEKFDAIVKQAFSQRRKTISNALKNSLSIAAIQNCNIDPKARAENLSFEDYIRLSEYTETKEQSAT